MTTLRIKFPDGQAWEVPLKIVEDSYLAYYDEDDSEAPYYETLLDWAQNNMNWEDLEPHAKKVLHPTDTDLSQKYCEATLSIIV